MWNRAYVRRFGRSISKRSTVYHAMFAIEVAIAVAMGVREAAASSVTLEGKVVAVADGDTITLLDHSRTHHKIRLKGIDAPEKGQPYGQRSKENLSRLVHGKKVWAECSKGDRYRRQVCTVWVQPLDCPTCGPTLDVSHAQLVQGLAWHYKNYESEQRTDERVRYADAEVEARGRRAALWSDKAPVAPWEWRKSKASNRSLQAGSIVQGASRPFIAIESSPPSAIKSGSQ